VKISQYKTLISSCVFGIVLGLSSSPIQAQTLSNADLGRIVQSTINVAVSEPDTGLGIGVAIQYPDGAVGSYATGYRNIEKTTALGLNDQFRIGSVSKTFTATAVLQQVNQGLFDIDDTVTKVAEKYGININLNNADNITIRQLLDMRSGSSEFLQAEVTDPTTGKQMSLSQSALISGASDSYPNYTAQDLLDLANTLPLNNAPGEAMNYNNTSYVALGMLVEGVHNKTYGTNLTINQIVDKTVVAPMGLVDTTYPSDDTKYTSAYANAYALMADGSYSDLTYSDLTTPNAAGAMISTPSDLLKWARQLGENNQGLLPVHPTDNQIGQAERIGVQPDAIPYDGGLSFIVPATYGLGILTTRTPGTGSLMTGHGGTINGGTTQVFWLPELSTAPGKSMGIVVDFRNFPTNWPENMPYQWMGTTFGAEGNGLLPLYEKNYGAIAAYWMLERNVVLALNADGTCMGANGSVAAGGTGSCSQSSVRFNPLNLGAGANLTVHSGGAPITGYMMDAAIRDPSTGELTPHQMPRPTLEFYVQNQTNVSNPNGEAGIQLSGNNNVHFVKESLVELTGINSSTVLLNGNNNVLNIEGSIGGYGAGTKVIRGDAVVNNAITVTSDGTLYGDLVINGAANQLRVDGLTTGDVTIAGTSRLQGSGDILGVVSGNGIVAPGNNGFGSLTVGSFVGTNGGVLEIATGSANQSTALIVSDAQNELQNMFGTRMRGDGVAHLTGSTLQFTSDGSIGTYTGIVQAQTINGVFAEVIADRNYTLSYDALCGTGAVNACVNLVTRNDPVTQTQLNAHSATGSKLGYTRNVALNINAVNAGQNVSVGGLLTAPTDTALTVAGVLRSNNGQINAAQAIQVANGGTLAGTGTLVTPLLTVAGTLKPGGSPGVLTATNTAIALQPTTGVLQIDIDGTTRASTAAGNYGRYAGIDGLGTTTFAAAGTLKPVVGLAVTFTAAEADPTQGSNGGLNGAYVPQLGDRFAGIVSLAAANSVSGAFTTIDQSTLAATLPEGAFKPVYNSSSIDLYLTRSLANVLQLLPASQAAAATTLDAYTARNLNTLSAAPTLQAALNTALVSQPFDTVLNFSGSSVANLGRMALTTSTLVGDMLTQQAGTWRRNAIAGRSGGNTQFASWLQPFAPFGTVARGDNGVSANYTSAGFLAGAEARLNAAVIGVSYGYAQDNQDFDHDVASTTIDNHLFNLYGEYLWGNAFVDARLGYSFKQADTTRILADGSAVAGTADGSDLSYATRLGYTFMNGRTLIEPSLGLRYNTFSLDGFTEQGSSAGRREFSDQDFDALHSVFEVRLAQTLVVGKRTKITPEVRLGWQHELLDNTPEVTTSLVALPQLGTLRVLGNAPDQDAALIGIGLTAALNDKMNLAGAYSGRLSSNQDDHNLSLNLDYQF
jgi:CubicO group peptidase (beta-lactamase class C family)/uncharacterized protein with beta-barrel porin domain